MALVVFLRGINVGGHRTFRPSLLARGLRAYDTVNVGAAGTLVVRRPGSRARFRATLRRKLPFETEVIFCAGGDLIRLVRDNPFVDQPSRPDLVRFVSILAKPARLAMSLPLCVGPDAIVPAAHEPPNEWLVRIIATRGRFVCGLYRRHLKTISCLGRLDRLWGAPATTRNWNTIMAVTRILTGDAGDGR